MSARPSLAFLSSHGELFLQIVRFWLNLFDPRISLGEIVSHLCEASIRYRRRIHRLIALRLRASGLAREREDVSSRHLQGLPPGRLLDIGCGDGEFLYRMKNRGWSVVGLDFDEQAARAAKEQYDIDVRVCRLEDMGCQDNSFDAVTMNHVIEHVFDPVATLREICRILKPGGIVVSVTPNAESLGQRTYGPNWRGLEPPRHIQIFSRQAMETAARAAGLDLVRVYSTAANAWVILSASIQLAESAMAKSEIPQRPSIINLLKAIALGYREARMNVGRRSDGEENVLLARKDMAVAH